MLKFAKLLPIIMQIRLTFIKYNCIIIISKKFNKRKERKMQRKTARENTFILLFECVCKTDETAEEIFAKATEVRGLEYDCYVKEVFFGAYENREKIDLTVEKHLVGWKKDRVSPVSRAILLLAGYEIMFCADIPARVSINEAIELSKKYDEEKAYAFINGVLNALSKEFSE